jgi:hypothetical protein
MLIFEKVFGKPGLSSTVTSPLARALRLACRMPCQVPSVELEFMLLHIYAVEGIKECQMGGRSIGKA